MSERNPSPNAFPAPSAFLKGRGAGSNRESRFDAWSREADVPLIVADVQPADRDAVEEALPPEAATEDPGWLPRAIATQIVARPAASILSRNTSPDIPFDRSINPYQGCEHGCVYCYARPTHAYLGLSPGLDFETKIFAKENAAQLLRRELSRPGYRPAWVALGANTDPYQPAERDLCITRSVLEVLAQCRHPVGITTKSALVLRDLDLLAPMAERGLVRVLVSITSLDNALARTLEPRANSPARRLEAIRRLSQAGVPVGVSVAPIIPALNDTEIESILEAAAQAGASFASHVLLRLPLEVHDLFSEWLEQHHPQRAAHVMSVLRQMHAGRDYDPAFGARMRGQGVFAQMLAQRFSLAVRRLGLDAPAAAFDLSQFRPPARPVRAPSSSRSDAIPALPVQSDLFGA